MEADNLCRVTVLDCNFTFLIIYFYSCLGDWEQALPIFDMLVKTETYCMVGEGLLNLFFLK